jgi:arabinan endo-1,5-alpha-L-arabinosidase
MKTRIRTSLLLALLFLLCGGQQQQAKSLTPGKKTQQTYKNPVVNLSLPDPTVIKGADGYFYLYATEDIAPLPSSGRKIW